MEKETLTLNNLKDGVVPTPVTQAVTPQFKEVAAQDILPNKEVVTPKQQLFNDINSKLDRAVLGAKNKYQQSDEQIQAMSLEDELAIERGEAPAAQPQRELPVQLRNRPPIPPEVKAQLIAQQQAQQAGENQFVQNAMPQPQTQVPEPPKEFKVREEEPQQSYPDTEEMVTIEKPKEEVVEKTYNVRQEPSNDFSDLEQKLNDEIEGEDQNEEEEQEKNFEEIKHKIKQKIAPVTKKIDLKSFTIVKEPISLLNALKREDLTDNIIDWVLPSKDKIISMKEFRGYDLAKIVDPDSGRNRYNFFKQKYQIIFDHIVDPNKPLLLETWLKTFNFLDLNELYFAIYRASFNSANYIPYQCPKCKHAFVSSNIPTEDMVKYKNNEARERIMKILESQNTVGSKYEVELVQVSNDYVIGFKEPTLYEVIFENVSLDDQFREKYSDKISLMTYIDSIYVIDAENNQLKPIDIPVSPDSPIKTTKSKIQRYSRILQTLTSDQIFQVKSIISSINEKHDDLEYIIPECKCPKCQSKIEESIMTAEQLLFTRHQLVNIANTSTK